MSTCENDQIELFDGKSVRDEAIDRVELHAAAGFIGAAEWMGMQLAQMHLPFTSADLRDEMYSRFPHVRTRDDRALGAVMRNLSKRGVIRPTGRYVSQTRRRNHCRPLREWIGA